jgi:hypothetical protein
MAAMAQEGSRGLAALSASAAAMRARHARLRALSAGTSVLAALLVLCVAAELTLGLRAYGDLLRSRAPGRQAILGREDLAQQWENGFDGHLPKLFDAAHMAGYLLLIAAGLVVLAVARTWQARAVGQAEADLLTGLAPMISRAGILMGQRLTEAQAESTAAAHDLRGPATMIGLAASRLTATSERLDDAVTVLAAAVSLLGDEIGGQFAAATDGLAAAGGDFAEQIRTSGVQAARDIGSVYAEAVAAAAAVLEEKMTLVGGQLAIVVGDVRTAAEVLGTAAGGVTAAVSTLSEMVAGGSGAGDTNGSAELRTKGP